MGENIAFSVFVEVNDNPEKLEGLTTTLAQILVDVFKNLYNIDLSIKLPNDIIYNGKKLGGILTVSKTVGDLAKYLVIGIGIDTNNMPKNEEVKDLATSIKKEFGIDIDNKKVIANFCNLFEKELIKRNINLKS